MISRLVTINFGNYYLTWCFAFIIIVVVAIVNVINLYNSYLLNHKCFVILTSASSICLSSTKLHFSYYFNKKYCCLDVKKVLGSYQATKFGFFSSCFINLKNSTKIIQVN
jgi:hypothetical protein